MLTTCPDCRCRVSDRAPACPQCGCPITAQTVELTGKTWKIMFLIGAFILLSGASWVFVALQLGSGRGVPVAITIFGLLTLIAAETGKWWYHS